MAHEDTGSAWGRSIPAPTREKSTILPDSKLGGPGSYFQISSASASARSRRCLLRSM